MSTLSLSNRTKLLITQNFHFFRFVVIVYPYHSRSLCTMGNCRRVVMIVWVLSTFLAVPVIWTKVSFAISLLDFDVDLHFIYFRMFLYITTPTAPMLRLLSTAMTLMTILASTSPGTSWSSPSSSPALSWSPATPPSSTPSGGPPTTWSSWQTG